MAIGPQNRVRKPESQWKHKMVQANSQPVNPPTNRENRLAAV
jgi:hypothetical protein